MTKLEKLAIIVTEICALIIYIFFGLLPVVLYLLSGVLWWFAAYVIILPVMLIVAATVQRIAIAQQAQQRK